MFSVWQRRLQRSARQRSLALASIEAVVVAGMSAFTDIWMTALLAKRLQADPFEIGLMSSLPLILVAAAGPCVGEIIRFLGGNLRAAVICSLVQTICLAGLYLPNHAVDASWAVPLMIGLGTVMGSVGAFGGPAWMNLMASVIPQHMQGRYSTERMRLFLLCRLIMVMAFSWVMSGLPPATALGFDIILGIAVLSRAVSTWLQAQMREEPVRRWQDAGLSTRALASRGTGAAFRSLFRGQFARWALIWILLQLGVSVAGPFFVPYLLTVGPRGLGMDPLAFGALLQVSHVVRLFALPAAGRMVDHYGGTTVLRMAMMGVCLTALGWALVPWVVGLVLVEVLSGLSWSLAEAAIGVLMFRCHSDPTQRARMVAIFSSVASLTCAGGNFVSGWMLTHGWMPAFLGSDYRFVFLLSALLRLPAAILAIVLLPGLQLWRAEVRREMWATLRGSILADTRGLMSLLRRPEG